VRVLSFYNLKGGVGKTTAAVNIAWEAASAGTPTLLWDLDPQAASSWYLGHDAGLESSAKKLIRGRQPIGSEVCRTPWHGLDLLPGDMGYRHMDLLIDKSGGKTDLLQQLIRPFAEQYALLILDCPPNFSRLSDNLFQVSDMLAVPVIPSPLALRAWEQLTTYFRDQGLPQKRLSPFLSMVDRRRTLHRQWTDPDNKILKRQLEQWIPYASQIEQMGTRRAPVATFAPGSAAASAFHGLWTGIDARLKRLPQRNGI